MTVELRVLGPVEARLDGEPVPIGPRQQAILALLLVQANQLVPLEQILDRVWAGKRPARPANAVQTQLTLLRRALPGISIAWQTGGYRLRADPATIDLHRFRDLIRQAADAPDEAAAGQRAEAIALWRGEPFAGIELPWFVATRTNLTAELDAAILDHADVQLRLGRHEEVVPALRAHAERHPFDERAAAQLMLALHGANQTDEALRHYAQLRDRLADELGADPAPPLRELHQRISTNSPAPRTTAGPIPRQLPPAPGSFTGRADELAAMTKILDNATDTGGTVVISAIAGTGGIGKTWLSLCWAHQNQDRFPDGQLFVDLRGFSPESQPLPAEVAVRGFLDALGVVPEQLPTSPDAQAALLRTLVADKRMLIVLDNAANAEQVRTLLPGGTTNTVLVNSRDRLSGLVTGYGAHSVVLDTLTDDEARDLLGTRLGRERLAAEPEAVDELLALCGGFPLALSIIAGHAQSHPDFPLAGLVADLREYRLHALDDTEPTASLPSVLSWSYTALSAEQARAFGLLGVAPGPDITADAAASLLDRSLSQTRGLLRALERASLLHQRVANRYGMHDLVRAYARDQAGADAEAAVRRVLHFYLHTAFAAEATTKTARPTITLVPVAAGTRPGTFATLDEAMHWFAGEYQNLTAAQGEADALGWDELTYQLAWTMTHHRLRSGLLLDNLEAWGTGLPAAIRLGDPAVEAVARQQAGYALVRADGFEEGTAQLTESIRIAAEIGDVVIESFSERFLCLAFDARMSFAQAESHARRSYALAEKTGNLGWISGALTNLAWLAVNQDNFEFAKPNAERSLRMRLECAPDDHTGMGNLLDCLGFIANGMGEYREAIEYYQRALAKYAIANAVYYNVESLEHIGHPYRALGEVDKAREAWREALRICHEQVRNNDAERIQGLLDELDQD